MLEGEKFNFREAKELPHLGGGCPGHLTHGLMPRERRMTVLKLISVSGDCRGVWLRTRQSYIFDADCSTGYAFPRCGWLRSEVFPRGLMLRFLLWLRYARNVSHAGCSTSPQLCATITPLCSNVRGEMDGGGGWHSLEPLPASGQKSVSKVMMADQLMRGGDAQLWE